MTEMKVILSINSIGKAVPYGPATHANSENYGFKPLKGKDREIEEIPEAKGYPAIISILKSLNDHESPFFSVGCEKSINDSQNGHWAKGYIEFSFNYQELVSDAVQYFPLFFHFQRYSEDFLRNNEVQFHWELQAAQFVDAGLPGFTACVWVTTGLLQSESDARSLWELAVSELDSYLSKHGRPGKGTQIYGSNP